MVRVYIHTIERPTTEETIMRKNTQRVFNAWRNGVSDYKDKSIWTDGWRIFSYNTPIIQFGENWGFLIDMRQYSVTTSNHQNSLLTLMNIHHHCGFEVIPR